jgi:hypothetical protein
MIEMSMPLSYHVCRAPAQRLLLAQLRQKARQRHPSDPAGASAWTTTAGAVLKNAWGRLYFGAARFENRLEVRGKQNRQGLVRKGPQRKLFRSVEKPSGEKPSGIRS